MNELAPVRPLRVRHQNGARLVQVARIEQLTPRMRRIVLAGETLDGFTSAAADDHVKLFLPAAGQDRPLLPTPGPNGPHYPEGTIRPIARDYTPRRFDPAARELTIDFVLHGDGPASRWAEHARPGQAVGIGGPRGSFLVLDEPGSLCLLVGDETALPAIGRRLEELPAGARAMVFVEVADRAEQLHLPSAGNTAIIWLPRNGAPAGDPVRLLAALQALDWPTGRVQAWMAGEIGTMRILREHLLTERGLSREQVRAAGYWRHGEPGAHTRLDE